MSDDEVEIVSESVAQSSRAGMLCQLCNTDIGKFSNAQRDQHYNAHLNSSLISSTHQPKRTIRKDLFIPSRISKLKRKEVSDEFWYSSLSRPPPENCSPGLIPLLKNALKKSHTKGNTCRAVLCWEAATHISNEAFDRRWGCGYRNFLMACAVLMSQQVQNIYTALLDDPFPPGVRNLQHWIEDAWKEGYDPEGAKDLKNCLVNTNKWIGTGELHVAFTSRGIPSQLVDFDLSTNERGVRVLVNWIVDYFSPQSATNQSIVTNVLCGSPVTVTDKMPLVLQYSGHSQTIVGYEISKSGDTNLLIFDPSKPPRSTIRRAAMAGSTFIVWEHPRKNQMLHSVMHPSSNGVISLLKRPSSALDLKRHKRTKSSESDDEVVIVEDSDDLCKNGQETSGPAPGKVQSFTLDPTDVVSHFRFSIHKLRHHQHYQILYFPMTDPWSIEERKRRRVVTSIVV